MSGCALALVFQTVYFVLTLYFIARESISQIKLMIEVRYQNETTRAIILNCKIRWFIRVYDALKLEKNMIRRQPFLIV